MIRLKKLKRIDDIIEYELIPEDSTAEGRICVDVSRRELIACDLPSGYDWCKNHIQHALKAIFEMADKGEYETETLIMWY